MFLNKLKGRETEGGEGVRAMGGGDRERDPDGGKIIYICIYIYIIYVIISYEKFREEK